MCGWFDVVGMFGQRSDHKVKVVRGIFVRCCRFGVFDDSTLSDRRSIYGSRSYCEERWETVGYLIILLAVWRELSSPSRGVAVPILAFNP